MQAKTAPARSTNRRGQTAVIAIVLLIGLVAVGSIGILLLGASATEETEQNAETERVEQGFLQLQQNLDSVAQDQERSRTTDLDLPDDSQGAIRQENAGQIVIRRSNLSNTDTIVVREIGAIVYEEDGVEYAYQGGAVWRGSGNDTQMVTAPNIVYETTREGTDPTLTVPITDLNGESRLGTGEVRMTEMFTRAPLNDVGTIDNQVVEVEITSEYYVGWGHFFEERYPNSVVTYDHPNDTVLFELGSTDINGNWNQSVYAMGGSITYGGGNNGIWGPVAADGSASCGTDGSCSESYPTGQFAPLDPVIERKVEEAETNGSYAQNVQLDAEPDLTSSGQNVYYEPDGADLDSNEDIEVDLSSGNVTLIVNGSLILNQDVDFIVQNGDGSGPHAFRVYMTGDLGIEQSRFCVAPCANGTDLDAEDNQIYGTSSTMTAIRGGANTYFEGAIYAPRQEEEQDDNRAGEALNGINADAKCDDNDGDAWHADFCMVSGSGSFNGGAITGPARLAQAAEIHYDPGLLDAAPSIQQIGVVPPPLTFLHVSVNKVCLGDQECNGEPIPNLGVDERYPETSDTVDFSAAGSEDRDGTIVSYEWEFGDGTTATGPDPDHSYGSTGTYQVNLTVTDDEGANRTTSTEIEVAPNTDPVATFEEETEGLNVTFSARLSGDDDGTITSYEWDLYDNGTVDETGQTVTHSYPSDGDYTVTLTVTDDDGATDDSTKTISISGIPSVRFNELTNTTTEASVNFTPTDPEPDLDTAAVYVYNDSGAVIASTSFGIAGDNDTAINVTFTSLPDTPSFAEVIVQDDDGVQASNTSNFGAGSPKLTPPRSVEPAAAGDGPSGSVAPPGARAAG